MFLSLTCFYSNNSEDKAKDAMFYSYTRNINGFSALLEEEEANEISSKEEFFYLQSSLTLSFLHLLYLSLSCCIFIVEHPEVKAIFLNKGKKLHTTRSWEFLGLEKDGRIVEGSLWQQAKFGEDVIIGNLDTGNLCYLLRIFIIFPVY